MFVNILPTRTVIAKYIFAFGQQQSCQTKALELFFAPPPTPPSRTYRIEVISGKLVLYLYKYAEDTAMFAM
jgi:hypothetical protein